VDWNLDVRRSGGAGLHDLPAGSEQVVPLQNPIRRDLHQMSLLSACRLTALKTVRIATSIWPGAISSISQTEGLGGKASEVWKPV
jgi:hypothetical protein